MWLLGAAVRSPLKPLAGALLPGKVQSRLALGGRSPPVACPSYPKNTNDSGLLVTLDPTSDGDDQPCPGLALPSCPKTQTNPRLARRAVSIVIAPWRAPDLGCVGVNVGDSGSPYAQGKHHPATGCHAPGRRPGSRPGPHLDQNVLAGYAAVALALILDSSGDLFSDAARPCQRPAPPLWRKRGNRKSRLETKTENEASSALLARLW